MTPTWLDDIILVTERREQEYIQELEKKFQKLEDDGFRASRLKTKIRNNLDRSSNFRKRLINQMQRKPMRLQSYSHPKHKKLKSFPGAYQYFSKLTKDLSKQADW